MEMQKAVGGKRMKNKKWKRMVGILVSIALLCSGLVGCSGKGNGGSSDSVGSSAGGTEGSGGDSAGGASDGSANGTEAAMGRFLEEEIESAILFANIFDMKRMDDGTIRLIGNDADQGKLCVWDSKDAGQSWEMVMLTMPPYPMEDSQLWPIIRLWRAKELCPSYILRIRKEMPARFPLRCRTRRICR